MLTILVAVTHQGNWRRVIGSAFFTVAGATLAVFSLGDMPGNLFLFALLGWAGFGILAKLSDAKKSRSVGDSTACQPDGPIPDNAGRTVD